MLQLFTASIDEKSAYLAVPGAANYERLREPRHSQGVARTGRNQTLLMPLRILQDKLPRTAPNTQTSIAAT